MAPLAMVLLTTAPRTMAPPLQAVRSQLPAVGRAAGWAASDAATLEAHEAPWGSGGVAADTAASPPPAVPPAEELFDLVVCTDPTQLPGYSAPSAPSAPGSALAGVGELTLTLT